MFQPSESTAIATHSETQKFASMNSATTATQGTVPFGRGVVRINASRPATTSRKGTR